MSWRKKVKEKSNGVQTVFANWFSQLCMMLMPRFLYVIAGRGSAKTTDIQVERLIEMVYDLPGAPVAWISDTYANLQKNVLRTIKEGLKAKGLIEGVHYVVGKRPPEIPLSEQPDLPPHLKEHFWKPYNEIGTYAHTIVFFTGFNVTFGSLDRPASLAGGNYVHLFGDEAKYFKKERVLNMQKAVRGMRVKYGLSPFYRGHTFTTDMPNTDHIGEYDWILERGKRMDTPALLRVLRAAFVMNDALGEYYAACESKITEEILKKKRIWQRWVERWTATRLVKEAHTLYLVVSSYVNVDILTPEWFEDAFSDDFIEAKTTVLSLKPSPEVGEKFYANLGARHFYEDGSDPAWSMRFGITEEEDCRILKYHDREKAIDAGVDFGNMISMVLGQESGKFYRCTKFLHVLSPDYERHLADKFLKYYATQREKTLYMYYDRAGNNYKKMGKDQATLLKNAIEVDEQGKKTGWKVILMSEGQGNIGQEAEYHFMMELLSGQNKKLPQILIDFYHCKPIRTSLELARTKTKEERGRKVIKKDKKSEQLPLHKLLLESTNPSDSWKYLTMRKAWRRHVRGTKEMDVGEAKVR